MSNRSEFLISETKAAVSRMANGETRMIVGTISNRDKSYRFCAAQTHWSDSQETRPPSISFRTYETSRPINTPGALSEHRKAVLSNPEVALALTEYDRGDAAK